MVKNSFVSHLFCSASLLLFTFITGITQSIPEIDDGPYIFYSEDSLVVNIIRKGQLNRSAIATKDIRNQEVEILPSVFMPLSELTPDKAVYRKEAIFDNVKRFAALSDIHGQYDLMMELFEAHGIVDNAGNWNYGDGHLVVTGDIMDRGDKCTEILWKLVQLEYQAEMAGGQVHVTMGNHELMVLKSDLRYIHRKYTYSSVIMRRIYSSFFDNDSFLGRWVRSRPVYLQINDVGFVHAGIHPDFFQWGIDIDQLNQFFYDNIVEKNLGTIEQDTVLTWMYYDNGPLWFRGLVDLEFFTRKESRKLLKKLDIGHLVVGHTSMPEIRSIYDNTIIFIDSSIKLGLDGELLLMEKGRFLRGTKDGAKIPLKPVY